MVLVILICIWLTTGCTTRNYESNIKLGNEQIQAENYLEAYEAFTDAYHDNETAEAKELKQLSKLLVDGISQYDQKEYAKALTFFEKAVGYDAKTKAGQRIIVKADEWIMKIDGSPNPLLPTEEGQLTSDNPATLEEGNMDTTETEIEKESAKSETDMAIEPEITDSKQTVEEKDDSASNKKITVKEAERVLKDFIEIEQYPQLRVQYDHDNKKGDYVFQVFESVEDGEYGHTATWGWYGVNSKTKDVYDMIE